MSVFARGSDESSSAMFVERHLRHHGLGVQDVQIQIRLEGAGQIGINLETLTSVQSATNGLAPMIFTRECAKNALADSAKAVKLKGNLTLG